MLGRAQFDDWTLSKKIVLAVTLLLVVSFGLFTTILASRSHDLAMNNARQNAQISGQKAAEYVRAFFGESLTRSQSFATAIEVGNRSGISRNYLNLLAKQSITSAPDFVFGSWAVVRPTELGGLQTNNLGLDGNDRNGIFAPYWIRDEQGAIVASYDNATYDSSGDFDEDYYKKPEGLAKKTVIDPYVDASNGKLMASTAAPIMRDGKVVGVAGHDLLLTRLSTEIVKRKPYA